MSDAVRQTILLLRNFDGVDEVRVVAEVREPAAETGVIVGGGHSDLHGGGVYAANLLGLSNQVPLRLIYLTDGPPRRIRIGKQEIVLKRTTPKNMATAGKVSGLVVQALRYLGKEHVDDTTVAALRRRIGLAERKQLHAYAHLAPAWIGDIMRQVGEHG